MRRSGCRKEPARTARGRLFACVFVMTQNASSPACVLRRRTNKQAAVCGAHERAVQHAKEMSERESDNPSAASDEEQTVLGHGSASRDSCRATTSNL